MFTLLDTLLSGAVAKNPLPLHRSGVLLCLVVICSVNLAGCGTTPVTDTGVVAESRPLELFYATDRNFVEDKQTIFGRDRSELTFGVAEVAIPPNHIIGRNEKPSVFRFELSEDERKHIALRDTRQLPDEDFATRLNDAIKLSPNHKLMVFVHGYNVNFPEAVRSLAQFATDLKFDGPVLLFSWPSQSTLLGYAADANNVEWSQTHLTTVLEQIADRTDAEQIYLFAHSMGSRALTRAHLNLAGSRPLDVYRFQQMILVAPDIDADLFSQDIAPRLAGTHTHVTLYASSADRALAASKTFNGHPRAGDSGKGLVIVPGVETVDVSVAVASRGFLGHTYFTEDRSIMEDIYAIISTGQSSDNRFGLQGVDTPEGRYWIFRR